MKNGNGITEGVVILIIVLVIALLGSRGTRTAPAANQRSVSSTSIPTEKDRLSPDSIYSREIYLSTGNASYSFQPYEEYVTIYNSGRNAINITNWQLRNAKGTRAYDFGGSPKYFSADIAPIGQGVFVLSPSGQNMLQDITLESGETAIVTTGKIGSQSPYKITSFKENICTGYIDGMPEYTFTPALTRNCPRPEDEPGVDWLDTKCRQFIERMNSCRTPEFDTRNSEGEICYGCVDNEPLSRACVAFIKNHFSYQGCIAYHQGDTNFYNRTWRVFLGQSWEMWARDYETISLFDQSGRLVDSQSY